VALILRVTTRAWPWSFWEGCASGRRPAESLQAQRPELTVTVIVPDLAVRHWWQRPLHEDTAARLRHALAPLPKVVVTSVPFHV